MGLFSWKCALTDIEIAHHMCEAVPSWMSDIVVLTEDGKVLKGKYDGYGRIITDSGTVDFYKEFMEKNGWNLALTPTVILQRAYSGEVFEEVAPSDKGEFQGHWFPEEYYHNADEMLNNLE